MVRAASTYVYIRQRLHPGLLDGLARSGVEAVEIFCARAHFNYHDRAHIRELANWFKSNNLKLNSLHSPMFYDEEEWSRGPMEPINIVETDRKRQIDATDEIKRALECAEHIPFRFLVQHLGFAIAFGLVRAGWIKSGRGERNLLEIWGIVEDKRRRRRRKRPEQPPTPSERRPDR